MTCSECHGSGQKGDTTLTCFTCSGTGVVPDVRQELRAARQEIRNARVEMAREMGLNEEEMLRSGLRGDREGRPFRG